MDEYKALELIRTKSEDALSRANTNNSLANSEVSAAEGGEEFKELKKRRKSSTVATERVSLQLVSRTRIWTVQLACTPS